MYIYCTHEQQQQRKTNYVCWACFSLLLHTYFQNKLWCSGCTNVLFCIDIQLQTNCVTFSIIYVKTYTLARRYIYIYIYCSILLNQNWEKQTILTKENIVSSNHPYILQMSPTCKLKTFYEQKALISFKFANKDSV